MSRTKKAIDNLLDSLNDLLDIVQVDDDPEDTIDVTIHGYTIAVSLDRVDEVTVSDLLDIIESTRTEEGERL